MGRWLLLSLEDSSGDVFERIDSGGRPGNFYLTHDREWQLNTMGAMRDGDPLDAMAQPPGPGTGSVYGRCADGKLRSLFGGILLERSLLQEESWANETWGGQWWGESDTHLVAPTDFASRVELRFECLADWADGGQTHAEENLRILFDRESRTFTLPDPIRHEADGPDYQIALWRGSSATVGVDHLKAESDAGFTVTAETRLDSVYDDWVKPIRALLAFMTLETVEAPEARCRLSDAEWQAAPREPLVDLHYPAHRRDQPSRPDNTVANRLKMLATLSQLQASGLDFGTLMRKFLPLHRGEHGTAISFINEAGSGRLDRSIDSKLLHTIRALEIYCQQHGIKKNLKKQIEFCVEQSGATGAEIGGLWESRKDRRKLPSTANTARERVAHGENAGNDDEYWDLHCHYLALKWIARHLYLVEMGLPEAGAADIMGQCRPFKDDKDTLMRLIR